MDNTGNTIVISIGGKESFPASHTRSFPSERKTTILFSEQYTSRMALSFSKQAICWPLSKLKTLFTVNYFFVLILYFNVRTVAPTTKRCLFKTFTQLM
jgi:hypothetical protein